MEIKNFEEMTAFAGTGKIKKVVVAAAHDEHALEAVFKACDDKLIDYLLVEKKAEILIIADKLGHDIKEEKIVEAESDEEAALKAVELIRENKGDFLMKGKMETKTLLKEVVNKETGIGTGDVMSHLALLEIPGHHKIIGFTDGGMILYPTMDEKKEIVKNAVKLFCDLGYECPKIAAVAAVEVINPKMQETLDGDELKKAAQSGELGNCYVEGPISCDLAFSKEAAEIKGFESPVTGETDIMLVPNIATGNIVTKALIHFAKAKMAGCVLGAKVPIVLSSRGASFEEKYYSLLLCAAQAK